MPFWVEMLLSLAAFALLVAHVAAVWALRAVARRAEAVLAEVLPQLPDAALLDTSSMDVGEAVAFVLGLARERGLSAG